MYKETDETQEVSSDPVIAVKNLSKAYTIWSSPAARLHGPLLGQIGQWPFLPAVARDFCQRMSHESFRNFYALSDVSFEVQRGESIGIVGRNGSGKSTLLQILAGTLAPSEGQVEVRGRVAALLELGSGFNPEFTGRENVFLNGAIWGIPSREMEKRFDNIAAFADIGEFIEEPVKTYSSGMFARLAFAVAISLEPDILIVDEILAVGDYGFQQKCVARLRQMRDNGLTLLFVSHSPDTIKSICNRGLFLLGGKTAFCGSAEQAVNLYFNYIREQTNADALIAQKDLQKPVEFQSQVSGALRYGTGHVQIEKAELSDRHGQPTRAFRFGEEVRLHVWYRAHIATTNLSISFVVRDTAGIDLMGTTTFDERVILPSVGKEEQGKVSFSFLNQLRSGSYGVCVSINRVKERDYSDNVLFDQIDSCAAFVIIPDPNRPVHYKFSCPIQIKIGSVAEKEHSLHIANN